MINEFLFEHEDLIQRVASIIGAILFFGGMVLLVLASAENNFLLGKFGETLKGYELVVIGAIGAGCEIMTMIISHVFGLGWFWTDKRR